MNSKTTLKEKNANNYLTHTKEEQAITLIALVVTIVVLLILAGVTIAMLGGENGIIKQATESKRKNQESTIKEEIEQVWGTVQINKNLNDYSNQEIATKFQEELQKQDELAEVLWNNSSSTYEIFYKEYYTTITDNGIIADLNDEIEKTELILNIENVQDTESIVKFVTLSIEGLPEITDEIEKELEDELIRQINEESGRNLTYEEFLKQMGINQYVTLQQFADNYKDILPWLGSISAIFDACGAELPNKYSIRINTEDSQYKVLALKGNNVEIALKNDTSLQVSSYRYTSNVIKQEVENDETYSEIYGQKTELEIDGYKVTVPAGFAIGESGTSIGGVNTGLVITDSIIEKDGKRYSNGNEFVWIPVETNADGNPIVTGTDKVIAKLRDESTTNYEGVLYEFTGTTSSLITNTNYEEPIYIDDSSSGDSSIYNTVGITAEGLQTEYNAMIASIKQHGGFYVSRYEMSIENENAVSKLGLLPLENRGDSNIRYNWYYMYEKISKFSNNDIQANMIWGSQYDAMLNFALLGEDKEKITSTEYGNYNSFYTDCNPLRTGYTLTQDRINNIYDLAGNVREWTLEKYYNSSTFSDDSGYEVSKGGKRVVRGGGNLTSSSSSSNRYYVSPRSSRGKGDDDSDIGTRFTLYLK